MAKTPLKLVESAQTVPAPPRKLGHHGRSLWDNVHAEYRIEDAGVVELLGQACQAVDRSEAIAAAIARDGEIIHAKTGLRAHPGLKDELQLRAFVCRVLIQLDVVVEALKPVGRPGRSHHWIPPA